MQLANWISKSTRRLIAPAIALVMAVSLGAYELAKPGTASAATPAPAAGPLDDSSVNSLLSLDQAMEQFAPAVGPDTMILPILNGIAHVDRLAARFGAAAGRKANGEIMSSSVTAASAVPTARLIAAQCGRVGQ